jgi:hypothetical protein
MYISYVRQVAIERATATPHCCVRSGIALSDAKLVLQLLERDSFGFRIDKQDDKELQRRHGRKEGEGQSP